MKILRTVNYGDEKDGLEISVDDEFLYVGMGLKDTEFGFGTKLTLQEARQFASDFSAFLVYLECNNG